MKATKQIDIQKMDIAFIVPELVEGSGGERNIFRAIKYLRDFGHQVTVYYRTLKKADASEVKQQVNKWFYDMGDIPFYIYDGTMKDHDVGIATLWRTAYFLKKNREHIQYPCYFVQDFEPFFYPMGSNYILAENSYRLGFSHICSGKWCKDFLTENYQAEAEFFQFPVDKKIYNMDKPHTKKNKNIVFLAKPDPKAERRCYELGILALEAFHKMRPEVEIIMYGSPYLDAGKIPFPATVHGLVPTLEELADIYRNADLGIVFAPTNPSLTPYEMLSCGCPVMDLNVNSAESKYGGSSEYVFLCDPEPDSMAEQLCEIMENDELRHQKAKAGREWVLREFPSEEEMCRRIEKMIQNKITTGCLCV